MQLKGKFFWCLERVKLLITNFIQWVLTNFCLFDDFVHLVSIFFLSPRNFPVSIFSQSQAVLVKLVVKEFLINQLSIKKILSDLSKFSLVMWEQLLYRLNKLLCIFSSQGVLNVCAIRISEQNWQRLWRHWFPFRNPRIQVNFCLSHKSIWYVWLKSSCRNSNETTVSRVTCCQIYLLTEINLLSPLLAMVLITDLVGIKP